MYVNFHDYGMLNFFKTFYRNSFCHLKFWGSSFSMQQLHSRMIGYQGPTSFIKNVYSIKKIVIFIRTLRNIQRFKIMYVVHTLTP